MTLISANVGLLLQRHTLLAVQHVYIAAPQSTAYVLTVAGSVVADDVVCSQEMIDGRCGHVMLNWSSSHSCQPEMYFEPCSEEDLRQVLTDSIMQHTLRHYTTTCSTVIFWLW